MGHREPAVTVLYFDGCPSWRLAVDRLRALGVDPGLRRVDSPEEAQRLGFTGSPTIFIDGRDPFASGSEPVGMSCRVYRTADGLAGAPAVDELRAALRAADPPDAPG